jgi:hypothetical protein
MSVRFEYVCIMGRGRLFTYAIIVVIYLFVVSSAGQIKHSATGGLGRVSQRQNRVEDSEALQSTQRVRACGLLGVDSRR